MGSLSATEISAAAGLIELALQEDLGSAGVPGDITTASFVADVDGSTTMVARQAGVVAGLPIAEMVFARIDPRLLFTPHIADGSRVRRGDPLASISGPMTSVLAGERIALNFVQHLSGIATLTRQYVDAVASLPARILDTRKTLPGWRVLAKYAVRQGGGFNHRMGLFDMILIKDNHWKAMPSPRDLAKWIRDFRVANPSIPVEVEVESLPQFDETLAAAPDIVLLDNMSLEMMREAVRRRNAVAPTVLLEASGGVTLQSVRGIAETGVDRI
ncbi:MAG TPA: carboxylating nicotinate-nucleotide diphosphorylase, partial [Gemmataceae bacterium]|nr:carboxylating nicotinate-nucleotide diphosphorylase [Gemmataceae bacterium]